MEKSTFWRDHGLVIFDHISLLSYVLANFQNFDADLGKYQYYQGPVTKMSSGLPADQPAGQRQPAGHRPAGHSKPVSQPARQPASHAFKNDTFSFIKLSQIHHFWLRSGPVPF